MTITRKQPRRKRLRLSEIAVDHRACLRRTMNEDAIRRYESAYRNDIELPPISVRRVGKEWRVVDGFHRMEALKRLEEWQREGGRREAERRVDVELCEAKTRDEAMLEAAHVNMRHGVPLKKQEIREVFRDYVRAKILPTLRSEEHPSYGKIVETLHGQVSKSSVYRWMEEDFEEVFEMMRKEDDGGRNEGENGRGRELPLSAAQRDALDKVRVAVAALGRLVEGERGATWVIAGEMLRKAGLSDEPIEVRMGSHWGTEGSDGEQDGLQQGMCSSPDPMAHDL